MASGLGMADNQGVDGPLRHGVPAAALADVDPPRAGPDQRQHLGTDEPVIHHHVGTPDRLDRAHRQQARVARPGADQGGPPGSVLCRRQGAHHDALRRRRGLGRPGRRNAQPHAVEIDRVKGSAVQPQPVLASGAGLTT